jgi:uncharacterized damage-inducible protein DinB
MNAKDAIKTALASTQQILQSYLSDLSDADLLVRPVPQANHIAWQLGHLISAENTMVNSIAPGACPDLPAGFADQHNKSTAAKEPATGFRTTEEYLGLFQKTRAGTQAALAKMSDSDLDKPTTGQMAKFAPTVGAWFLLQANHTLMHAGQVSVARRKLGKPIVF